MVICRASPATIRGARSGGSPEREGLRPKKCERETASPASVPKTSAMTVAPIAA